MPAAAHPIANTLARISAQQIWVKAQLIEVQDGWQAVNDLLDESNPLLDGLIRLASEGYHTTDRQVLASMVINAYSWPVVATVLACYITERRVPDIGLDNVMFQFAPDGRPAVIGLREAKFAALSTDPCANHADVTVFPSDASLLDHARLCIEQHMHPLIKRVRTRLPWGERAMWLTVADRCTGALNWFYEGIKDPVMSEDDILVTAQKLIHAPGSRLKNRDSAIVFHPGDHSTTLVRGVCCLAYRLPDGDYCGNCPLAKS
jgi:ferric iron reductase protein FhuF